MKHKDDGSVTGLETVRTVSLCVIAGIVLIAGLKHSQPLAAPLVFGFTLGVVFGPAARGLSNFGLPPVVGAFASLLLAMVLVGSVFFWGGPALWDFAQVLPQVAEDLGSYAANLMREMRGLGEIEADLQRQGEEAVAEAVPSLVDAFWLAPNFLAQTLISLGVMFFFLLTRDDIYSRVRPDTANRLRAADRAVSRYIVIITLINAGLGVAVWVALMLIGLPNAMIWGAAAFLLNFMLYLGPIIMMAGLTVAGVVHFEGVMLLAPPAAFLTLNLIEAQFATPTFVGQHLSLNPLMVFVAIMFGLWLWGPIGAIVALPVVVWVYTYAKPQD